jgi:hypothetical protein
LPSISSALTSINFELSAEYNVIIGRAPNSERVASLGSHAEPQRHGEDLIANSSMERSELVAKPQSLS